MKRIEGLDLKNIEGLDPVGCITFFLDLDTWQRTVEYLTAEESRARGSKVPGCGVAMFYAVYERGEATFTMLVGMSNSHKSYKLTAEQLGKVRMFADACVDEYLIGTGGIPMAALAQA